ncbi:MAG: ligD [Actinomycetia bacterium]|nr:ligD [Actinomycetes bacterium]
MPELIVPMLAVPGGLPDPEAGWAFEVKWDGLRAVTYVGGDAVHIRNRRGIDIAPRYPELAGIGAALEGHRAILDGEIVVFDDKGRPSFGRVQQRMHVSNPRQWERLRVEVPAVLVAFDVMWLDGESMLDVPYLDRRAALAGLGIDGPSWRAPAHHLGNGKALLAEVAAQGLEGLMAKRVDSVYTPGRRSSAWQKVKALHQQELVIGGWLPGKGARENRVGALLLGYHDPDNGGTGPLVFAGRVGTGFTEAELDRLGGLLGRRARSTSPFAATPKLPDPRWVRPDLVCEVRFTEWTSGGQLRQPAYLGTREDKPAAEVVRES